MGQAQEGGRKPGPRRPLVMSGLSVGDSEGGEGPGRVGGVVTEGGGEVDRPGSAEHADGEVAQQAMTLGPVPVRTWEASSAKVVSRTWCRPFSIAQCPAEVVAEPGGAGLGEGEAGDW
jgi:hypothetical protein